jgi:glycosyltransferase involved in cell wall biosynthesis
MRILLSAYACEPNRGSEPGVGWNMAQTIARRHQVHVLTSATHKPGIEAEMAQHPNPNLTFSYLDPLGWVYDWSREKRFQVDVHLHYYMWQIKAYQVAKRLHQREAFDLAHHVTYVKYYSPSFLAWLPIPFLWGPVGGAEAAPQAFWCDFNRKNKLYETLRNTARGLGELDPFVAMTAKRSTMLWATTNDTAERLRSLAGKQSADRVEVMSALYLENIDELSQYPLDAAGPMRFISLGRLLHWKGFHLGLKAFAAAKLPDAEFWVVGTGPEEDALKALAQSLGIAHQVKFWGRLPQPEAMDCLTRSTVLVHPSLHDSGGWVCLEAMATGRPVICLDLGGPGVQVTAQTGFKIPATNPTQSIAGMADAMQQLSADRSLLQRLSAAGQAHIRSQYNGEHREVFINQLYDKLVQEHRSVVGNNNATVQQG